MRHTTTTSISRASAFASALALGTGIGTLVGAIFFFVEVIWIHGSLRPYLGVTLGEAWSTYLLFGAVIGFLCGIAGGIVVAVTPQKGRAFRLLPVVGGFVGITYTALFLLRDYSIPQIRTMPGSLLTSVVAAIVLWGLIITTGSSIARRRGIRASARAALRTAVLTLVVLAISVTVWQVRASRLARHDAIRDDLPNVVMIVVDAMRFDHLGAYGYARPTSPNIDRLASEGALFEKAYSHGNRTIIAMPALFTSLYPSFHGAIGFQDMAAPLPLDRTTIAEVLRGAGYTTVGLMSNIYLKHPFALTQGFDHVEEFNDKRFHLIIYRALRTIGRVRQEPRFDSRPLAETVTDKALHWMERAGDRPFFLYTHYMDVHHPYRPPAEIFEMFDRHTSSIDANALFAMTAQLVKQPPPLPIGPAEVDRLIDFYDSCIRYTDGQIGRILEAIRSDGRETIVIVTADHGDEFMEHGSLYHNNLLIEELIRVPLIVWRSSDAKAVRVPDLVRHVDVLPTLAGLVGVDAPDAAIGESLVPYIDGGDGPDIEETISEGDFCTALNTPEWKIMQVDTVGAYYLFDLMNDPHGFNNVAESYPEIFAALKQRIDDYLARASEVKDENLSTVDPETYRQLRALGYIQ